MEGEIPIMSKVFLSCGIFISIFNLSLLSGEQKRETMKPVPVAVVDLKRYVGLWYEIAKIPNRFQRKCAGGTTAQYTLRRDGRIDVVNRCLDREGKPIEARGIARITDTRSNAKLKVSFVHIFGKYLFWGDYWIIGLDQNYNYAVIGGPTHKYGWILSRKPRLASEELEKVFSILREQGYDPAKFEMTEQSQNP